MNIKVVGLALLIAVASHYAAYYVGSQKTAQIVEKEVIRRDVVTQIVEVTRPDGSKEVKTIIKDKTKEKSSKQVTIPQKDWMVGAYYRLNDPTYALSISRKLIGPISGAAFFDLKGNVYLGATIEF